MRMFNQATETTTNGRPPAIVETSPPDDKRKSSCLPNISKFLNLIAIEPLAFLAIMALYIEFPSIQDLIYTKICLQVVSKYPNLTLSINNPNSVILQQTNSLESINSMNHSIILLPKMTFEQTNDTDNNSQIAFTAKYNSIKLNPSNSNYQSFPDTNQSLSQLGKIQNNENKSYNNNHHIICDRLNKSATPKEIRQEIASGDSLFWLKYQLLICILCAITSPYWGGMSDRIGRLIPLNVPIFMSILSNLISLIFSLLISLNSHNLFDVEWLYLGATLIGISGGQAVIIINSFSFISDNTSSDSRSKRVVILESVIFVSHSVGFYISKHIMSLGLARPEKPWFNRHFVAFSTCILINVFAALYSFFNLRHRKFHRFSNNFEREQEETFAGDVLAATSSNINVDNKNHNQNKNQNQIRDSEQSIVNSDRPRELTAPNPDDIDGPIARADKSWSDFSVFMTIKYYVQTYETLTKKRESRTIILLLLLLCGFISALSLTSLTSLLFIYLRSDPFNWSTSRYSYWNSISSLTRGIALVCLTLTKLFKVWDLPDPIIAAIGFLSKGIALLMIAMAQTSDIIDLAIVVFTPSEFSMPPIRSLLSKLVIKEEVGKLYSCLAAIQSVCFILGLIVFYLAYTSLELKELFRLCFLGVACSQFAAVIIMLIVYTILRHRVMII